MIKIKSKGLCALAMLLILCTDTGAQEDTASRKGRQEVETARLMVARLAWACAELDGEEARDLVADSVLADFYVQINRSGSYRFPNNDTASVLTDLLKRSYSSSAELCLLPFIRAIDPRANVVYADQCYTRPEVFAYPAYCREPKLPFIVLFYIHFMFVDPPEWKKGYAFTRVLLEKKDDPSAELTSKDYQEIGKQYEKWIMDKYSKNKTKPAPPLKKGDYGWVIGMTLHKNTRRQ